MKKRGIAIACLALLMAAVVLFFASKSSPGYPINDWSDANIFLTAGKGMLEGKVLYRDLYDHKGPLLYALHALCAWVSPAGFTGVYAMEVVFTAAFLLCGWILSGRLGSRRFAWVAIPLTALLCCTCYSLGSGDSAEELCLPLMAFSLCTLLPLLGEEKEPAPKVFIWNGFAAGCVFWMKYTLVGLQAGLFLMLLLRRLKKQGFRACMGTLGYLLLGAFLSTVPWLIYFGVNGAIGDWLRVYFVHNLLYASSGMSGGLIHRVAAIARAFGEWLWENPTASLPMGAGFGFFLLSRRFTLWQKAALAVSGGLAILFVFIGGDSHFFYYGYALCAFVPLGMAALTLLVEKGAARLTLRGEKLALCGLCVLCAGLSPLLSYNMRADYGCTFGQPREETMQYKLAAIINETPGATLCNYGFMDAGFYTAAGIAPNVKYYHQCNIQLEEMYAEQQRYLREGLCDYVVTRALLPEDLAALYELAGEAEAPNFWYEKAYLYRKKDWKASMAAD